MKATLALAVVLLTTFAATATAAPTWLPAQNLQAQPTVADGASTVASDSVGESFAGWNWNDGANTRVQIASHAPGGPWSAPTTISPGGHDASAPSLSLSATGFGAIAFTESNGAHVVTMVALRAPGAAFGTPTTISSTSVDAGTGVVAAVDAAGDVVVAWNDQSTLALHARRFTAATGTWGAITDLQTTGANQSLTHPSIVMSAGGVATVAWLFDSDATATTTLQVETRTQTADGTWGGPTEMTPVPPPFESGPPRLAVDAAGNVTMVWFTYVSSGSGYSQGLVFQATLPASANGVWQTQQALSDNNLVSDSPVVAATPAGEVTVAWTEALSESIKVVTRPAGGSFPAAGSATGIVPNDRPILSGFDTTTGPFTSLALAAGATGTVATFARSDSINQVEQAVYKPAGSPWPNPATTPPTTLSAAGNDVQTTGGFGLALDGLGNAVATWTRNSVIQAAALDVSAPAFTAVSVPATGSTGLAVPMSATTLDTWSALGSGQPSWNFGDNNLGAGATVTHVFAVPGTYTVTIGAADAVGNAATPVTRQIVITNATSTLPSTTIANPKLKATWKGNHLVGTVSISGTVGLSTTLTASVKLRGGKKTSVSARFAVKKGAWSRTLKLPSGLAPGTYVVTVGGASVSSATTTFTLKAPATGLVKRSYASGPPRGPAVTKLGKTTQLWAHFQFGTLPKKGQKITTQWILPSGRKLSPNSRPRTTLVEAQVKDLSGHNLPTGRWRCLIRVGGKLLVTLNVRLT